MLAFQAWCDAHIRAPAQRQWFASQMQSMTAGPAAFAQPAGVAEDDDDDDDPLAPMPGETDEAWQERHGFYHLTPGAVKIFDASRKFREERARDQAEEARREALGLEEQEEAEDESWNAQQVASAPAKAHAGAYHRGKQQTHYVAPHGQGKGTRARKRQRKMQAEQQRANSGASTGLSQPSAPSRVRAEELEMLRARALQAKRPRGT